MNQCCVRLHDSVLEGKVLYRPIIIFFIIDAVMCPQHRSAKMKVGYVRLHLYLHYGSIIDLILFFCKIFSECLMLVCCFFSSVLTEMVNLVVQFFPYLRTQRILLLQALFIIIRMCSVCLQHQLIFSEKHGRIIEMGGGGGEALCHVISQNLWH